MFKVALCGLTDSKQIVEEKISVFLGTSATRYTVSEFETTEIFTSTNEQFDLYFLNKKMLSDEARILADIEQISKKTGNHISSKMRFVTFTDNPVTDKDCDVVIDCIRRYLEYDSMYLAVEFLTNKGIRSIAISRILFFEYINRRIKIKTHNNEYFCDDTLYNIMSLIGNYSFLQPHKSFIANLKHITEIKNYQITMSDGSTIPLSQKKSKAFREQYSKYIKENSTKVKMRKKNS